MARIVSDGDPGDFMYFLRRARAFLVESRAMKLDSTALRIFVVLVALFAVQMAYFYPQLPDTVASHFGAGGKPDGWSSKQAFFTIFAAILAMMVVIFLGIPFAIDKLPASWINLPKKDYWLAPERKPATMWMLSQFFLWYGNATLILLIFTLHLTALANLETPPRLGDELLPVLVAYMAFVGVATVWLLVKLWRTPPR